jgi:erythromycin esterase
VFARVGMPIFVADLRAAPEESEAHQWLEQHHPMRSIGAVFSEALAASFVARSKLPEEYDAIIFIDETTRARPNALTRRKSNMPDP